MLESQRFNVQISSRVLAGFTIGSQSPPNECKTLLQVHGARGIEVDSSFSDKSEEGDWLQTSDPEMALGIRVADCTAILAQGVCQGKTHVLAAHAGWRGTAAGILDAVSEPLRKWEQVRIWMSPSICQRRFEVGGEVLEALGSSSGHFALPSGRKDKFHLDLKGFQISRLKALLPNASIQSSSLCTFEQPEFFSYRRSGLQMSGRHTAWIQIVV